MFWRDGHGNAAHGRYILATEPKPGRKGARADERSTMLRIARLWRRLSFGNVA